MISGVSEQSAPRLCDANIRTELYQHIFQPFETAVLTHQSHLQPSFLTLYSNLLHHWTTILRSTKPLPSYTNQTISSLVTHVHALSQTLIQTQPSIGTSSLILSFYEQFTRLIIDDTLRHHISIELPPATLIYTLFFSNHATDMSRVCFILARFKSGFNEAVTSGRSSKFPAYTRTRAQVNAYNGFLMDICNGIWRNKAFNHGDANEHGYLMPQATLDTLSRYLQSVDRTYALGSILNLSHSSTLSHLSLLCTRELEDQELEKGNSISARHAGPITDISLHRTATAGGLNMQWRTWGMSVLDSLNEKDLPGVAELLQNTMLKLKKDMAARQANA